MLPFGTEEVTLLQWVEDVEDGRTRVHYSRHDLSGCSWRRRSVWTREGSRMVRSEEICCRIPAGQVVPRAGDVLFRGSLREPIEDSAALSALMEAQRETGAFRIASVADNTGGAGLAHYAASGESV